ncbi:MAG: 5'-nucleotidase C-terminal domain-containing protein [Bacilli bacterium]|nr:5'-nucleotidase C-terminal domain-containing protein [Bacilli bacterium]
MKIKPMKLVSLAALIVTATYFVGCANKTDRNDLVILYTNDVHGFFGEKNSLTYSSVAKLKQELIAQGNDVLLVDAGDHSSGSINANYDDGATAIKLMNMAGYDVVTFGNHEFDGGVTHLQDMMQAAKYKYISTNFYHREGDNATTSFTDTSKIFNFHNHKVGVIGITTPETIGDCTPDTFQDENGNYIYTFLKELNRDLFFQKVQAEVNQLKANGCETVIALTHLGEEDDEGQSPLTSVEFVKGTTGIDLVIDAHTHQYMPGSLYPNKDGKLITITQTGSSFLHIGQAIITRTDSVYTKMINNSDYSKHDEEVKKAEDDYIAKIEEELGQRIATMDDDVHLIRYREYKDPQYKEYNLPDFCADGFYYYANSGESNVKKALGDDVWVDGAFINNGGIKNYDVKPNEEWLLKTGYETLPFPNHFVVRELDGRTLWEAIEFSVRETPDYNRGLLIPAGIKYNVDTTKKGVFKVDESGNYLSGPNYEYGEDDARVSNIKIYTPNLTPETDDDWEEIKIDDPTRHYYIAGSDYILKKGGDSLSMLSEAYANKNNRIYSVYDSDEKDYIALNEYVRAFDNSIINSENSPLSTLTKYASDCIDYKNEEPNKRIILPTA